MFDLIKSKITGKKMPQEEEVAEEGEGPPIVKEEIEYVYDDGTPASKEDIAASA
jgi:hypothetical protein